jgi:hypothetical protein
MKHNDSLTDKKKTRQLTTVTVEEVFAAGGATEFGLKSGKNNETLIKALENSPKGEPFTEEEWASLMEQMANDK